MNPILLVARRDFLQIIATRAFKITLLIVPLMLGLVILGTSFMRPPPTVAYIVADRGGSTALVIAHRVELDYQRQVLRDLSAYAARWKLPPPVEGQGYQADDAAVEACIRPPALRLSNLRHRPICAWPCRRMCRLTRAPKLSAVPLHPIWRTTLERHEASVRWPWRYTCPHREPYGYGPMAGAATA
jgi:hypothetical protein